MPKLHICLSRGVNISVLRHEAEFYGITPLGMLHSKVFLGGGLQFKQHGSTSQVLFWLQMNLTEVRTLLPLFQWCFTSCFSVCNFPALSMNLKVTFVGSDRLIKNYAQ